MTPIADLIMRYDAGGPFLVAAVKYLSDEHATTKIGPGDWTIAELVVHMLDSDLVGIERMKRVIAEPDASLQAFDETAWTKHLKANTLPFQEAADLFAANRKWMTRILRQTPESDFSRAGIHSARGRVTLAELVSTYVNHLDHHLRFLYAKRGALGVGIPPRYTRN